MPFCISAPPFLYHSTVTRITVQLSTLQELGIMVTANLIQSWVSVPWSCLVLVDGFIKAGCLLFELCWTDITKKTMSPFSVVKYLDVPEQIGPCFFTSSITNTVHSLA